MHDNLREMILSGELEPGATISQVQLSIKMGVSRTPLREALRRLQQEGLIEAERNRRARVVGFDAADLEFVYTSRILYEAVAIMVTIKRLSVAESHQIVEALAGMRAAKDADDYRAWEMQHGEFHRLLLLHAEPTILAAAASLRQRSDRYRRLNQRAVAGGWNFGDADHEAIAQACTQRRSQDGARELSRHLARTALSLLASLRPEYDPVQIRETLHLVTGLDVA